MTSYLIFNFTSPFAGLKISSLSIVNVDLVPIAIASQLVLPLNRQDYCDEGGK